MRRGRLAGPPAVGAAARPAVYPSVTPLVAAAHWDEREARDLLGIVPIGHPDPRRLILHERWPRGYHPLRKDVEAGVRPPAGERRFVPFEVHGEGVYQLPVGPIHAGIIEPGHFQFSAIGERILHLDARLFFVHRGVEKLAEGRSFMAAAPLVERVCGVCTVTHALAYAQAVESLTSTAVPPRAPGRGSSSPSSNGCTTTSATSATSAPGSDSSRDLADRLAQGAAAAGERCPRGPPLPHGHRGSRRARVRSRSRGAGRASRRAGRRGCRAFGRGSRPGPFRRVHDPPARDRDRPGGHGRRPGRARRCRPRQRARRSTCAATGRMPLMASWT